MPVNYTKNNAHVHCVGSLYVFPYMGTSPQLVKGGRIQAKVQVKRKLYGITRIAPILDTYSFCPGRSLYRAGVKVPLDCLIKSPYDKLGVLKKILYPKFPPDHNIVGRPVRETRGKHFNEKFLTPQSFVLYFHQMPHQKKKLVQCKRFLHLQFIFLSQAFNVFL